MMEIILSPPVAFLMYVALIGILVALSRVLSAPRQPSAFKLSNYASGEAPWRRAALPGYRPYFRIALFFAVLHLGVLMLASGNLSLVMGIYVIGLAVVLVALLWG
jgi:NADH:ubiquinone oxidoreductase subunit 3 (subunit A)